MVNYLSSWCVPFSEPWKHIMYVTMVILTTLLQQKDRDGGRNLPLTKTLRKPPLSPSQKRKGMSNIVQWKQEKPNTIE